MHLWPSCHLPFLLLFLLLVTSFWGCGKGFDERDEVDEEEASGHYMVTLRPLNTRLGSITGNVSISVTDKQFWVRMRVYGEKSRVTHPQYLHMGNRCPDARDDTNRDGYIDFVEAHRRVGHILIPLDTNLNTQTDGMNNFPTMKKKGWYYYSESCNIERMMADLHNVREITEIMVTKLPPKRDLDIDRRVIIIYGVEEDLYLPDSVRSYGIYPSQYTIPVACGEIIQGESGPF